jgi:hypothetical protein
VRIATIPKAARDVANNSGACWRGDRCAVVYNRERARHCFPARVGLRACAGCREQRCLLLSVSSMPQPPFPVDTRL